MINALLATAAIATSGTPQSNVDQIVAMAWAEAASQDDKRHQEDLKSDAELGKKYSEIAEKEVKLSTDAALIERVQRIGNELAVVANQTPVSVTWGDKRLNKFEYTFKVIEDKDINAFSLPGGFIYFHDGLVKYAESDDEIAGVMAHEIAHASLRHIATLQREQEKLSLVQLPLVLIGILSGAPGEALTLSGLIGAAKGSGWSVKAEQAADFAGFQYMLKSKFDPTGMLTFMEHLAKDERSRPSIDWGIFRTRPPGRERAEALTRYMTDAGVPIRRSKVAASMRATAKPAENGAVEVHFGTKKIVALAGPDAERRAEIVSTRFNEFFDSMPELYDIDIKPEGEILGRRQTLVTVTTDDAAKAGKQVADLQQETVRNLRSAIYNLTYRVWDIK